MRACGVVVEYNPFHNGHQYHLERARDKSRADCMIAVMSGNFLQRGEPAIIDKYERTKAALASGIDIVIELPFAYAVQSSHYFALGSVRTLNEIGVSAICFGSEQGNIDDFITAYHIQKKQSVTYKSLLKKHLAKGLSYPAAHSAVTEQLMQGSLPIDLTKPNNILGLSYVTRVLDDKLPIELLTIKRMNSDYHDQTIKGAIASATSIRQQLFNYQSITEKIKHSLPEPSINTIENYRNEASIWHSWENYYPFLKYRVLTMSSEQLAAIHHVDEGLENRIVKTAKRATSFEHWMQLMKTKRYTWTRLQRMFVHILTNTLKTDILNVHEQRTVPYLRLLGFTKNGQRYLNQVKKQLTVPLITQISRKEQVSLMLDERASNVYYSVLPSEQQNYFQQKDLQRPIIIN